MWRFAAATRNSLLQNRMKPGSGPPAAHEPVFFNPAGPPKGADIFGFVIWAAAGLDLPLLSEAHTVLRPQPGGLQAPSRHRDPDRWGAMKITRLKQQSGFLLTSTRRHVARPDVTQRLKQAHPPNRSGMQPSSQVGSQVSRWKVEKRLRRFDPSAHTLQRDEQLSSGNTHPANIPPCWSHLVFNHPPQTDIWPINPLSLRQPEQGTLHTATDQSIFYQHHKNTKSLNHQFKMAAVFSFISGLNFVILVTDQYFLLSNQR